MPGTPGSVSLTGTGKCVPYGAGEWTLRSLEGAAGRPYFSGSASEKVTRQPLGRVAAAAPARGVAGTARLVGKREPRGSEVSRGGHRARREM